ADRDGDGRVGIAELFEHVAGAVEQDARRLGLVQRPWSTATGTGGVYLSRCRSQSQPHSLAAHPSHPRPAPAVPEGGAAPRLAAGEGEMIAALDRLGDGRYLSALPWVFKGLASASAPVRERARRVVRTIGWDRVAAAIEEQARGNGPEGAGTIGIF